MRESRECAPRAASSRAIPRPRRTTTPARSAARARLSGRAAAWPEQRAAPGRAARNRLARRRLPDRSRRSGSASRAGGVRPPPGVHVRGFAAGCCARSHTTMARPIPRPRRETASKRAPLARTSLPPARRPFGLVFEPGTTRRSPARAGDRARRTRRYPAVPLQSTVHPSSSASHTHMHQVGLLFHRVARPRLRILLLLAIGE